jgi:hypothetical protein
MAINKVYHIDRQPFQLSKFSSTVVRPSEQPTAGRLVLRYQNALHEVISLRLVVSIIAAVFQLPMVHFDITWSQHSSISKLLVKHAWVSKAADAPCFCCHIPDEFKVDGHLMTVDFNWALHWSQFTPLMTLLRHNGLSHVPTRALDIDAIISEYCKAIPTLIASGWPFSTEQLMFMFMIIIHNTCTACMPESYDAQDTPHLHLSAAQLSSMFTIEATDKAKNHPCFMCKHALMQRLAALFHTPTEWTQVTPDICAIRASIRSILSSFDMDLDAPVWAVPHQIFKAHKKSLRTIIGNAHVTLSPLSIMVSDCSKHILDTFQDVLTTISEHIFTVHNVEVKINTVVQDSLQAAINLPSHVAIPDGITCDIKSCYDVIPLDPNDPHSIISRMKLVVAIITEHFGEENAPVFYVRKYVIPTAEGARPLPIHDSFTYTVKFQSTPITRGWTRVTMTQWVDLLHILLKNSYVQFGQQIWQNMLGVPQGVHPAPFVINLHFLSYELEYVLSSLNDPVKLQRISKLFRHFMRLIDDVSAFGIDDALTLLLEMYPAYVVMDVTWKPMHGVNGIVGIGTFLNMEIIIHTDGRVTKHAVFKEDKLPFAPVQYVHSHANRSRQFAKNIILGQMIVALMLNDHFSHCVSHFSKLISIFLRNGFESTEISQIVTRYLKRTDFTELQNTYSPLRAWHTAMRDVA